MCMWYLDSYIARVSIGTFIFVRKFSSFTRYVYGQGHTITLGKVVWAYGVIFWRIQLNWGLWFKLASHD
jgi:hypothetical protein